MQEQIERDLKAALLSGDKQKVETLKALKNGLQYEAVSLTVELASLTDEQITKVLSKEAKKRQEAADLYKNANELERAEAELKEKAIIDAYLPARLDEAEVKKVVQEEIAKLQNPTMADMGRVIGAVRARLGAQAEGSLIARLVKESLSQ